MRGSASSRVTEPAAGRKQVRRYSQMTSCHVGSFFFFQAEDGIRDLTVTGVQTCALPIWRVPLEQRRVSEEGKGVVVEDPVVLRSDDAGDGRRGRPLEHRFPLPADRLEVLEDRKSVV